MRRSSLVAVTVTLILGLVGMADAALGSVWDLFALFSIVTAVQVAVLLVANTNRVPVTVRPDLSRWAVQRSQRTGEPVEDVIDRSIAWYQQGLQQSSSTNDH